MNPNENLIAESFVDFALLQAATTQELFFAKTSQFNINIILYCCWAAKHNQHLTKNKIKTLLAVLNPWHRLITLPLMRAFEHPQKLCSTKKEAILPLFLEKIIKSMQLEQKILADVMFDLTDEKESKPIPEITLAGKNINNYLAELKVNLEKSDIETIKQLISTVFHDADAEKLSKHLCTTKNTKRNKALSYLQLKLSLFES